MGSEKRLDYTEHLTVTHTPETTRPRSGFLLSSVLRDEAAFVLLGVG